ncbi:hypothetical protein DJ568_12885 [Mucilaginibacter hurinus]|uniref:Uncharacterized protein n=1 Tax=Mucilaginibacter hurinus TaxID=2201324 RepID=A0A367GL29_9SPHI|nr:hypothetical protein [Mucilaginibacter hurinus]RCH54192.1 hypothetical protein DJ568_12885 [Mucilaginibacter hurinus]
MQFLFDLRETPADEQTPQHKNDPNPGNNYQPVEGNLGDEDDEDFDDLAEAREDMQNVAEGANLDEPLPEDDDHLPDDDLQ